MNSIADDTRKPMDPSGIRFGTPAITTRGLMEADCREVAELMIRAMKERDNPTIKAEIREQIRTIAHKFPIPDRFVRQVV